MPCTDGAEIALPDALVSERAARWQVQRERFAGSAFYQRHHPQAPLTLPTSLADIAQMPFTDKEQLRADQAAYPPFGSYLAHPRNRVTRLHRTSDLARRVGTGTLCIKWTPSLALFSMPLTARAWPATPC